MNLGKPGREIQIPKPDDLPLQQPEPAEEPAWPAPREEPVPA